MKNSRKTKMRQKFKPMVVLRLPRKITFHLPPTTALYAFVTHIYQRAFLYYSLFACIYIFVKAVTKSNITRYWHPTKSGVQMDIKPEIILCNTDDS